MAKILSDFQFAARRGGRGKHNWDELLDGQIRQLDAADFPGGAMPKHFGAQVHLNAKSRGLAVRLQKTPEGGLVLQAYRPEGGEGADAAAGPEGRANGETADAPKKGRRGRKAEACA